MNPQLKRRSTYLELWDILSPRICRLIARKTGPSGNPKTQVAMTDVEIAAAAQITPAMVQRLSHLDSWEKVPSGMQSRFKAACGITPATESAQLKYLVRTLSKVRRPLHHTRTLSKKVRSSLVRIPGGGGSSSAAPGS